MMHLDFQVGDLDSAVAEAVVLGASLASAQPRENVRSSWPAAAPSASAATTADRSPRSPIMAGAGL